MKMVQGLFLGFVAAAMIFSAPLMAESAADSMESNAESPAPKASVPKPGNGVATFLGGTSVAAGEATMILNYNYFQRSNAAGRIHTNVFAPVLRVGLGKQWDIVVQTPMRFVMQNHKRTAQSPGFVGRTFVWFHKQHLVKQFEESTLMVATNYLLSIPTTNGMDAFWGVGFGVGLTWNYRSMRLAFDFQATAKSNKQPMEMFIKAGYHHAINDYFFAGIELNWDSTIYNSAYNGYTGTGGSHNVFIGPMVSVKIPQLNNSAWGVAFFYDVVNKYQAQNVKSKDAWKITSRITVAF